MHFKQEMDIDRNLCHDHLVQEDPIGKCVAITLRLINMSRISARNVLDLENDRRQIPEYVNISSSLGVEVCLEIIWHAY